MDKLFLDDVRSCPIGWALARDYNNFVRRINSYSYDLISFDHDLAPSHYPGNEELPDEGEKTGLDCARYTIAVGKVPKYVIVHSMNPVGADRIVQEFMKTTAVIFREVYSPKGSRIATLLESEEAQEIANSQI